MGKLLLLLALFVVAANGECPGDDGYPEFTGAPEVALTDLNHVSITWTGLVSNEKCVTKYKVEKFTCKDERFMGVVGNFSKAKTSTTAKVGRNDCYKFRVVLFTKGRYRREMTKKSEKTKIETPN